MTKVSVLIPAYNAEETLSRTLETVMIQTYDDLEIIIVDDGSKDSTADIVREAAQRDPRIILIQQKNAGVATARNTGIEAATGEWIAPVDADDLWHPRKIELQMKAAQEFGEEAGMVYAWSRRIDEHDRVIGDMGSPRSAGDITYQLLASNIMRNASSSIFRRDLALEVGGFDAGLQRAGAQGAEDLKIYLALAKTCQVALAPYFLTGYRLLENSMSQNAERMRRSVEMVLLEHEGAGKEYPDGLFNIARMNYDLYAAGLALASKDWPVFAKYIWRALRRRPVGATVHLSLNAFWMAQVMFRSADKRVNFADVGEDVHLAMAFGDWFTRFQSKSVERVALHESDRARGTA